MAMNVSLIARVGLLVHSHVGTASSLRVSMHLALSWDISASGERWKQIDQLLLSALKPYSWVRPLKTVYVVKMASEQERVVLLADLTAKAKSVSETVHFLISPLMDGGRYDGYLPSDSWPKINERTS
jgi:hypothetical protein